MNLDEAERRVKEKMLYFSYIYIFLWFVPFSEIRRRGAVTLYINRYMLRHCQTRGENRKEKEEVMTGMKLRR